MCRCWSRSRSCSTSARPTGCSTAAADRDLFFAINFNHRYAEPVQLAPRRDRAPVSSARSCSPPGASAASPAPASTPYANLIETQCHGFDMLEHLVRPDRLGDGPDDRPRPAAGTPHSRSRSQFANGAVGTPARQLRLVLRLPRHARPRSQRHRGPAAHRRHRQALHAQSRAGTRPGGSGRPATSTTPTATSTTPSTRHVDALLAALRPARPRRSTRAPAAGRWSSPGAIISSFQTGRRVPVAGPR